MYLLYIIFWIVIMATLNHCNVDVTNLAFWVIILSIVVLLELYKRLIENFDKKVKKDGP